MSFVERIGPLLEGAVEQGELAGIVATVECAGEQLYAASAGHSELDGGGAAYEFGTPLRIASMTKAVTSVAAMQLVERGLLELDTPVSGWLPRLETPMVLEGDGTLRAARTAITARQLLTHTSGFAYPIWDDRLAAHLEEHPLPEASVPGAAMLAAPLVSEPGTQWEYSISTDWVGELVVAISGQSLGEYFTEHIFGPLGMVASGFRTAAGADGMATLHQRQADGSLLPFEPPPGGAGRYESGGGGLYSTASDYGRFLRMLLGRGALEGRRVLEAATVDQMATSQTGDLGGVGVLTSTNLAMSNSEDMSFGHAAGFGLGFLVTLETSRTGRSAGSLSWAGMFNTYYWIDLERDVAGAVYTQVLPLPRSAGAGPRSRV
jgi:methyl acetate hydrolase